MASHKLKPGFIEEVDRSEFALGADTDSSYCKIVLPFNKFEDPHRTVDYAQKLAKKFNEDYQDTFRECVEKYGGVDPEYNLMNFKSEVVAYRGMFVAKKYYGLVKLWEEGSFYDPPTMKKTGGQIVKADITKITQPLLQELYHLILEDFSITDEVIMYQKIFIDLKKKYHQIVTEAVKNLEIKTFGIPKKWGLKKLQNIPKQVQGAMLYNYLFSDNLRPGDSVLQCQVLINSAKLQQLLESKPPTSKYQITKEMATKKLNVISFPVDISDQEIKLVKEKFNELDIKFDLREILMFNVDLKLDQFQKIFTEETKKLAI